MSILSVEQREMYERVRIIQIAKSWLGTPFVDQQGLKGCGVDCAYFLARIYEEMGYGKVELAYYSPQVYLHRKPDRTWDHSYEDTIRKYMREIQKSEVKPGDAILYEVVRRSGVFTHGGIVELWPDKIIHPVKPHGVIYSAANEGFVIKREYKFFTLFPRPTDAW